MSSIIHELETPASRGSTILRWSGLAILFALLLTLYFDSWHTMKRVWDIPTYTHGYVVPLISAWLAWRQRDVLGRLAPATGWSALAGMALCGLLWLAGDLAGVNAAQHFAIMALTVLLVPLAFGWPIARALAFPLGFLFFAVPFGDFLLPWMMEATAAVTIGLVRLSGVPIYREGLSFVLPSGSWEIIEECSGQRYLVAALPLACLYAWLSFRRNRTRWLFVLFAAVVALLANWLRAWGIVMLGHLSEMKVATGVDHLIYGWAFFGIVMALLFWIGSRWTEAPLPQDARGSRFRTAPHAASRAESANGVLTALLAGAVLIACWPWLSGYLASRDPGHLDLAVLPAGMPAFTRVAGDAAAADGAYTPPYRGARQEVRLYSPERSVSIWIGSYEDQRDGREMIQHSNSITSRTMKNWTVVAERMPAAAATNTAVQPAEYVLAGTTGRWLVWRSYFVDGRFTPSEARAKLMTAWRVARGRGDRSIAVLLWTPLADNEISPETQARTRLGKSLTELAPLLAKSEGRQ